MRTFAVIPLVVLMASAPGRSFGQASRGTVDSESPEQVATRYVTQMSAGNWRGMAALMHPDALKALHEMFGPLLVSPNLAELRQQLFGITSPDSVRAVSDTDLFVALMSKGLASQQGFTEAMKTARVAVIGHVPEGHDTVHVVYRLTMTFDSVTISKEAVMSLRRYGSSWRGLLTGDVSGLAAMLKRAAGS